VDKTEHLPIIGGDPVTVSAAIYVGEVKKLLGVFEQDVGISGVNIPEHDGSCSEGGGCLAGQIGPLRLQDAIFRVVNK
jgi:hypothetical protein